MHKSKRVKKLTYILLVVGIFFLVASTYFMQSFIAQQLAVREHNFSKPTSEERFIFVMKFVLIVVVMISGIIGSYIFEKAKNTTTQTINLRTELAGMISSSRFIMALVVCPLTFNSIYIVIGNNPENIGDYLLAFQNGFFWESIVGGVIKTNKSTPSNIDSFDDTEDPS
ncbi:MULTISPECIES: hypothetical protein [unclassified Nostoc]|uniref:hypothetical protein n=1 Tax=unclassified Nostoc TaxID=2593658 RepID=UPI002AD57A6D|nr:hypothetical protein [Nostoc sp. ChiQUE02]MDZ8233108.1 hypothetical protein [Nostoc sp. ChiQUE02]